MKIEPKHNLKKPAYAIGAAVLATTLLTGCPGNKGIDEFRTSGEVAAVPPSEESSCPTSEFVLEGDVQMIPTEPESVESGESGQDGTEVFVLDGDVAVEDLSE